MSYVALYRVWRPSRWEDVVDQKAVIRILKNALTSNKVSHAYLFAGPRGTGKTTVARLLAKAVNCNNRSGAEPCNACLSCVSIADGSTVDVIEIDAASNRGIDEMRSLREAVRYVPVMGGYKVYIIDEVHMLTQEAFNALLKTLEEPPEHVIFIMATTAPHKIPVTITSRCQRLDFRRLTVSDIETQMQKILGSTTVSGKPVTWEPAALRLIARAGQGSMRDALSILDLCLTYGGTTLTEDDVREILGETSTETMQRLFRAIAQRDVQTILDVTRDSSDRGKDMGELCQEIGMYARDMLLLRSGAKPSELGRPQDEADSMISLARTFSTPLLIGVLEAVSKAAQTIKTQDDPRLALEVALLGLFMGDEALPVRLFPGNTIPSDAPIFQPVVTGPASASASGGPGSSAESRAHAAPAPAIPETERSEVGSVQPASRDGIASPASPTGAGQGAEEPVLVADPSPGEEKSLSNEELAEIAKAAWPRLMEALFRSKRVKVHAYLLQASPSRVEGGKTLVLSYPKGYMTHMEQIMVKENKRLVEVGLYKLTGKRFEIDVETSDLSHRGGSGGNGHEGGSISGEEELHPLVRAAITILDGKIVSRE